MTMYNIETEKAELDKAMAEAPAKIKALKTFDVKGEPVIKPAGSSKQLVQIMVKVTGASRNYSQTSQNYLKGECDGNGNEATDAFKKIWNDKHGRISTDEASQWIGRSAYNAILMASGIDVDNAPATVKTNSEADLDDLVKLDPKRAEFEIQLKAHASAILSRYLRCVTTQQVMSRIGHKLEWQALDSFSTLTKKTETSKDKDGKEITTEREEVMITPADLRRELRYMDTILSQYKALTTLKDLCTSILKNSGDAEENKAKIAEIEAEKPLIEGQVKANEEAAAKAERAAAREDKKADKDKEIQANIIQMATEFKMPTETIAKILKLSESKVKEILDANAKAPAEANN